MTKIYSSALSMLVVAVIALVAFTVGGTATLSPAAAECVGGTATPTATGTSTVTATPAASPTETSTPETQESSALTGILTGNLPLAGGGFGTFAFCGGTFEELLITSGCPEETAVFFYNKPDGAFAVWIPGSGVAVVNEEILDIFPGDAIPEGTIFTARCV